MFYSESAESSVTVKDSKSKLKSVGWKQKTHSKTPLDLPLIFDDPSASYQNEGILQV